MDSHIATPAEDEHDSAYSGLLVNDAHWAFGTDFEDPLAGVDTTIPDGVDAPTLAAYALMLGDDALVMSHRISEWTSNAPDLEDDIALSNIALDLLGQARLLLAPFERLRTSRDHAVAAVAAKGVKELAYHRDYSARSFVTLAQGTDESRRRLLAALDALWPLWPELFDTHAVEAAAAASGVGVDPAEVREAAEGVLDQVLDAADVPRPAAPRRAGVLGRTGRDGMHGEALGRR